MVASWKYKACSGMDFVQQITFARKDTAADGKEFVVSAVYVPGADQQLTRDQWTQAMIDAIGDQVQPGLDTELAARITASDQSG